jgi:hypothetical protein
MRLLLNSNVWTPSQAAAFRTPLPPFHLPNFAFKFPNPASNHQVSGKSYLRIFDHRRRCPMVGTTVACVNGQLSCLGRWGRRAQETGVRARSTETNDCNCVVGRREPGSKWQRSRMVCNFND